jgi:Leu/Phe-tRNA-protein transferase
MYQSVDRACLELSMPIDVCLARVANFMRVKSVSCFFHPGASKIECRTPSLLRFEVYFWRSSDSKVILELQRREGCVIEMHRLRRSLFYDVLTGEEPNSNVIGRCATVLRKSICPLIQKLYQEDTRMKTSQAKSQKEACNEDLEMCHDLLESSLEDQNRLGMESLLFLTDKRVVTETTALQVARAIVFGQGLYAESLRDELLFYFRAVKNEEGRDDAWPNEDVSFNYEESHNNAAMHNLALRALGNALKLIAGLDGTDSEAIDLSSAFWDTILCSILYNIKEAIRLPQEAALSTKCIALLEQIAHEDVSCWIKNNLLPALIEAYKFGKAHNLELEQESGSLLRRFS